MADTHTDWNRFQSTEPTFRARYNVARNSSGVTFDMTVEATWTGTPSTYIDADGAECSIDEAIERVTTNLCEHVADQVAWSRAVNTHVPKPGK